MSRPRFFSWSKGRQASEQYHRTGGLLSIDTSVGDSAKVAYIATDGQNVPTHGRRLPPNLNLTIPADYHDYRACLSPASARHNAALVNSASNLLAVVNDMLRSPALSATFCPRSAEIHKPLPSRPRSISMPSTPVPPVELPGSLLLENQGFPPLPVAEAATGSSPTGTMRSARTGNAMSLSAAPVKPSPSRVPQHKKSLSETNVQRRSKSRQNLITSPSSTDSKLTTCSASTNGGHTSSNDSAKARVGADKLLQPSPLIIERKSAKKSGGPVRDPQDELGVSTTPTPTTARTRQIEELENTITAQDSTISTLQAQFTSLRASHDAHVTSLIEAHAAEVASLKNYNRVLEEQQAQRTLHHASSSHLLLFLDPTEPQSPNRGSPQETAGSTSATSARSFQSALEQPTRSPHSARDSPDMENLKRKLSTARRPDTGNRDMIRDLNMYKNNNAALQRQIESLMAKLNQSKQKERNLTITLEQVEKTCTEWQEKASKVEQLEKSTLALQNTIDHLEHRLDMANCEKLDAEEQLFNYQSGRSPFDPTPPKLRMAEPSSLQTDRHSGHASMSTVFSSGSPTVHSNDAQESSTLAAFIAHIERLQEQIKQKDARNAQLELETERLRQDRERLEHDHRELSLQLDIQGQLLQKTKEADVHMEQLRTAIMDRESVIAEKERSLRMAERQLEHHKLLLHTEVRKHASMVLFADTQDEPLPDLASLASKEDMDRWISRLQARLKKAKSKNRETPSEDPASLVEDLKQEVDFYVREIIYYKLDIKGYKSDIKKLKHIAARMGNYGSRASDIDSPTPSHCRSADTPTRSRLSSGTPGLGISSTPSPISTGPISASVSIGRPVTPPAAATSTPDPSSTDTVKPAVESQKRHIHQPTPRTPKTPPFRPGVNLANEVDNIDPGISPRSVARLSPERRKPTPPSPDQEKFGDMATNFPLNTPAAPTRHDTQRSMSDSIIQLYSTPRTPDWLPALDLDATLAADAKKSVETRQRSASVPDPSNERSTPERPPRPQYGLYESPTAKERTNGLPAPPRMDVMAEAMRSSPDKAQTKPRPGFDRKLSNSSTSEIRGLSNSQLSRTSSAGSGTVIPGPLSHRPRAGSAGSSTTATAQPASPPRKLSTGSGNNIPFIIGMPSPHNPALISPTTTIPPTTCSITGKCASTSTAPPKPHHPTSRIGIGGTMASSTPLSSPTEPTDTAKSSYFGSALPIAKTTAKPANPPQHTRSASMNSVAMPSKKDTESSSKTSGHARNMSASSIRNAMQLPSALMKGKGKARKESISHPTPLDSPFDIERTNAGGVVSVGRAV